MNQNDVKRSVSVGVFVLIGLIIGLSLVYMLANKDRNMGKEVLVTTVWDDVNGLRKGNNIWFSGVKIGNVKSVEFREDLKVEVVLGIEEPSQKYIRKNAQAKLGSDGLIGNKIIVIEGGTPDFPQVETGDLLKTTTQMSTEAMMATLQDNNDNLKAITDNLKVITSNIAAGQGLIGHLLTSEGSVKEFDQILRNLQVTTQKTVATTNELSAFASKVNNNNGLVNSMLTDSSVFNNIKAASVQLSELTASTKKITENLDEVTRGLKSGEGAAGKLLNDKQTAQQVTVIVKNLEETSVKLNENMEAMRHNFLFKRYFKKQEKEEKKAAEEAAKQE